ncbi:hypothetical protein D6783_02870 [Candidatus Woesearchaeota archaeon]|nr:MAG: hypothetical protein D6783_02870 [Candidatus Woesearchaeota archaeon]
MCGNQQSWRNEYVDLSSFVGNGTVYVRFTIATDSSVNQNGYAIDDFSVTGEQVPNYNVSTGVADGHVLIQENASGTGPDGVVSFLLETASLNFANYSAVALATRANFTDATETAFFEVVPDTTPPNVTLVLPEDFAERGIGLVNFTYYVYDINLANCTLYFGSGGSFAPNETDASPVNDANNTFADKFFGLGVYEWNVYCSDTEGNAGFAPANFTLNITGPDLAVFAQNITFGEGRRVEGVNTTVFANITNQGLSDATDPFIVQFFKGDPDAGGEQVGSNQTVPSLLIGEVVTLNVSFTLSAGDNNIFVVLDPNNTVNESDESNNEANNTLVVSLYQIFYGNVSKDVVLDSSDNKSLFAVVNVSTVQGHIFIADVDSSFSFANLQALTRTTTDVQTGNDLTEADALLNTSSFNDSLKNVWGGGSDTPLQTETFVLETKTILHVPVVNSTNSSAFVTGLLWDAGDDASLNQQFDQTDKEDLVFVTRINESMQGAFGVYDYEIKVPALLRTFKPGSDAVAIFYEIT